jgi:hypothetical protein
VVSGDAAPVGHELAGVVEDHYTVAQQTPSLLRVKGHEERGLMVGSVRGGTLRLVLTHLSYL